MRKDTSKNWYRLVKEVNKQKVYYLTDDRNTTDKEAATQFNLQGVEEEETKHKLFKRELVK